MQKVLLVALGTLSLCCGIVGIVVPGLPTTPFVLLAAWCYMRSSDKLYRKLLAHPHLGRYITSYSNGVSRSLKYRIFALMWLMIAISTLFFISSLTVKGVVIIAGIIGTLVVWMQKEPEQ